MDKDSLYGEGRLVQAVGALKQIEESVSDLDRRVWAASQKLEEATLTHSKVEWDSVWGL